MGPLSSGWLWLVPMACVGHGHGPGAPQGTDTAEGTQAGLGRTVVLELMPGEAAHLEQRAAGDGTLFVWVLAEPPAALRVEGPDGRVQGSDSTAEGSDGPAAAPLVEVAVRAGDDLRLEVLLGGPAQAPRTARVHVLLAPQDDRAAALARTLDGHAEGVAALLAAGDRPAAADRLRLALEALDAAQGADSDTLDRARWNLSIQAATLGLHGAAAALRERVVAFRERYLPPGHPRAVEARQNLAMSLFFLGRRAEALAHFEAVLAARLAWHPPAHGLILDARTNLAVALRNLGERARALEQDEAVLTARRAELSGDDPRLVRALFGTADSRLQGGDARGAGELYDELVERLAGRPARDPQRAEAERFRARLAALSGDARRGRALLEAHLEALAREVPEDHPAQLEAIEELAVLLYGAGYSEPASHRFRRLHDLRRAKLGPCAPETVRAVIGLVAASTGSGDTDEAARRLGEVLDCPEGPGELELAHAHHNLGAAALSAGDRPAARVHLDRALDLAERALPPDHADRVVMELNQAQVAEGEGELAAALERLRGFEALGERGGQTWLPDVRCALGRLLLQADRWAEGRAMLELGVAGLAERRPDGDLHLMNERLWLARARLATGVLDGAAELLATVDQAARALLPAGHRLRLTVLSDGLLLAMLRADEEAALAGGLELARELSAQALRAALLAGREAEAAGSGLLWFAECLDSVAAWLARRAALEDRPPPLDRAAFEAHVALRGLGLAASEALASLPRDGTREELLAEHRAATLRAARAAAGHRVELLERAVRERDALERTLLEGQGELAASLARGASVEALGAELGAGEALVLFARGLRYAPTGRPDEPLSETDALSAFVLRAGSSPQRIELGPTAPIERALGAWRGSLGVAALSRGLGLELGLGGEAGAPEPRAGAHLTELLLAPLTAALGGAQTWILVPDDLLHLVPFDALPLHVAGDGDGDGARERLGERVTVRVRAAPLSTAPRPGGRSGGVLLVGGVDYGPGTDPGSVPTASRAGAATGPFAPLPGTLAEVRALADLAAEQLEDEVHVVTGSAASAPAVAGLAAGARVVHLATHGFFADPGPRGRRGGLEAVQDLSPLALCGLALAPAGGAAGGVVSAAELAAWDLSSCELAVLSACESGLGLAATGQGLASLAKALHLAGAADVVLSLWKVDDGATRELMERFYAYLWREGLAPHAALWRAKQDLRAAGRPPRDWAGWVVSSARG